MARSNSRFGKYGTLAADNGKRTDGSRPMTTANFLASARRVAEANRAELARALEKLANRPRLAAGSTDW